MSIYGPCSASGMARQEEAGGLKESKEYTDDRARQLREILLPKTGGTISGSLGLYGISLDRRGVSISRGGSLSVNTLGGGPEVDIRQGANNTENTLPGGIRLRDPGDRAFYQLGWSADGNLAVYYSERGDIQIQAVAKFSPTHLTSLALPVKSGDAASKEYVDSRKQVVTIWAEEKGPLTSNHSEWSFGSAAEGRSHAKCGYPMSASGRLARLALACTNGRGQAIGTVTVSVVLDGITTDVSITKDGGKKSSFTRITPPLEIRAGTVINFVSRTTNNEARSSIVSAIIELDL